MAFEQSPSHSYYAFDFQEPTVQYSYEPNEMSPESLLNNEKQHIAEILNDIQQYQSSNSLVDNPTNNMLFMDIDTSMVQDVVITKQEHMNAVKKPILLASIKPIGPSGKPKRIRTNFTSEQLISLENHFIKTPYLNRSKRIHISKELNLQERQVKIWFQNRRMKLKRETEKAKLEKKSIQPINNSDGESRSSSTSSDLFNSNVCGPSNDREICQNLMKYQNYGREVKYEIKQEPYYNNEVGNGQPMEQTNYNQWNTQITAQSQWQSTQEENLYPTDSSHLYSEFDIHESSVTNNVQHLGFDEHFEFDEPVFQILGSLIADENSN